MRWVPVVTVQSAYATGMIIQVLRWTEPGQGRMMRGRLLHELISSSGALAWSLRPDAPLVKDALMEPLELFDLLLRRVPAQLDRLTAVLAIRLRLDATALPGTNAPASTRATALFNCSAKRATSWACPPSPRSYASSSPHSPQRPCGPLAPSPSPGRRRGPRAVRHPGAGRQPTGHAPAATRGGCRAHPGSPRPGGSDHPAGGPRGVGGTAGGPVPPAAPARPCYSSPRGHGEVSGDVVLEVPTGGPTC